MYLFYFIAILSLLQLIMFRMPGLLLILVVAYAIYSLMQSRKLHQSSYAHSSQSSSSQNYNGSSARKADQDIFDAEYTEHEL